jgi:hypothetical protein
MRALSEGHEICNDGPAGFGLELGLKHESAGTIAPTDSKRQVFRSDQPPAVFSSPEQASKACSRIEARPAQPIDRAVTPD